MTKTFPEYVNERGEAAFDSTSRIFVAEGESGKQSDIEDLAAALAPFLPGGGGGGGGIGTTGTITAGDFPKFTNSTTVEGRDATEVKADLGLVIGTTIQAYDADLTALAAAGNSAVLAAVTSAFTTAQASKLSGIEAAADVTDAANVLAAGALMEGGTVNLTDSTNDFVTNVKIYHDGSSSSGWIERLTMQLESAAGTGVFRRTFYLNEYGEIRVSPGRSNTVAFRMFQREYSSHPARDMTAAMFQLQDNRNDNNILMAIMPDGCVQSSGGIVSTALTSYTPTIAEWGKTILTTAATAVTFTVPPNSSAAYQIGSRIDVAQTGAGQVTFAPGSGVTLNSTPGLKIAARYGAATLIKTATNEWLVVGNLAV